MVNQVEVQAVHMVAVEVTVLLQVFQALLFKELVEVVLLQGQIHLSDLEFQVVEETVQVVLEAEVPLQVKTVVPILAAVLAVVDQAAEEPAVVV
jgi:hypothetical protein